MSDILQAARSYYGLADTESCTTQLFTNQAGQTCVAFEIPLSNEDFAAIVQRMQNMQQEAQQDMDVHLADGAGISLDGGHTMAMRTEWESMTKREKGKYGSFGMFLNSSSNVIVKEVNLPEGRQVVHVDTPEEPEPTNMDAVWLHVDECSQAQINHAVDWDRDDRHCLVSWAMLTDEQKQKAKEKS